MKRLLLFVWLAALVSVTPRTAAAQSPVMIDDFETYSAGGLPTTWKFISKDETIYPVQKTMKSSEKVVIHEEGGNQFARATANGEALRISLIEGEHFAWDLDEQPRLQWKWRANHLPQGASERDKNDTGGAIYITFDEKDWLGRPRSLKYTYSSSLDVDESVSFGNLKALVASSANDGTGEWKTVTRNVKEDYRRLFGEAPPSLVSITMWSDSDTTGDAAEVDFDDIQTLPSQ